MAVTSTRVHEGKIRRGRHDSLACLLASLDTSSSTNTSPFSGETNSFRVPRKEEDSGMSGGKTALLLLLRDFALKSTISLVAT